MCISGRRGACVRNTGFNLKDAGVFSRTQWEFLPWLVWFLYRVILAIYYVGGTGFILIASLATQPAAAAYFFIYLTDWTVIVVVIYLVVAFINVVKDRNHGRYYHCNQRQSVSVALSWRHKFQWLLLNIYMNVSILVTVIYWSFLRAPIPILLDLSLHAFPCVLGFIDIIFTPIPVRIQHAVYPMVYGVVYVIFTVIYWAAGGTDPNGNTGIYPGLLDWEDPATSCITIACSLIAVIISQLILWGIYKIKIVLIKKATGTSVETMDASEGRRDENTSGEEKTGFYENVAYYAENDELAIPSVSQNKVT